MRSTIKGTRAARLVGCITAFLLLGACSEAIEQAVAQEPSNDTACALDGMMLKDFPGPKAQIQYAEGAPDFFCDVMELFAVMLEPEQKRRMAGVFVQDMGKANWDHPNANWIAAKTAVYVVGGKKRGSMGPTFGSFSTAQAAATFVKQEGGKVVQFDQITPAMVNMSASAHGAPAAR